jgi:hypothetical protein
MSGTNHVANLEALLKIVANGTEALTGAWEGPVSSPKAGARSGAGMEAEFNKLASRLQGIQKLAGRTLSELRAGRGEAELEDLDHRLKDAGRVAERLRIEWRAEGQADEFLELLSEAAEVTLGPMPAGTINWLVSSASDGSLLE